MKCPHCGNELSEYAITCPNCGGDPTAQPTQAVQHRLDDMRKRDDRRAKRAALLAFALSLLVGFGADAVGVIILRRGLDKTLSLFLYAGMMLVCLVILVKHKLYRRIRKPGVLVWIVLSCALCALSLFLSRYLHTVYALRGSLPVLEYLPYLSADQQKIYKASGIFAMLLLSLAAFLPCAAFSARKEPHSTRQS